MDDLDTVAPAPFGERRVVDGHELTTYRLGDFGAGEPVAVLLPGGGSVALDMWRVQEGIARFAAVLAYDRAGTGWSGREVALPRGLAEVTDELLPRASGT